MSTASKALKPIFVVAGVGSGSGTGSAAARVFARAGYTVALLARNPASLNTLAEEIKKNGGEALPLPIPNYSPASLQSAFGTLSQTYPSSTHVLRAALYNSGDAIFKPFLSISPEDFKSSLETNLEGSFAFAQEVIKAFKGNDVDEKGRRGTLIFTGATAGTRGGPVTSAFSVAKFGIRALSQSLAKEFGKENIHVAHAIIDGHIQTNNVRKDITHTPSDNFDPNINEDTRLQPEQIAANYLYLVDQHRSTWTWELDLRPAHEKW
jgi:NAD(P)-dependent dehydrogenase (short-subunit alcohol dehydrogenase family)